MCAHNTWQVKLREMKPGVLSRELKEALGMPDGAPPPWLINMQVKRIFMQLVLWLMNRFVSILTSYKFFTEIWPPTLLSSTEDSWSQCSNSSWCKFWISTRRMGKTSCWRSMLIANFCPPDSNLVKYFPQWTYIFSCSLIYGSMGAPYTEMFLESYSRMNLTMMYV